MNNPTAARPASADFPPGCALVIGASGGLGSAIAGRLADAGSNLVLTSRSRAETVANLASKLEGRGAACLAQRCDITDAAECAAVTSAALARFGRIHSVFFASGLDFENRSLADTAPEALRRMLDVDLIGFLHVARATLPAMRAGGGGAYVALTTTAVHRTFPGDLLGSAPKAALTMMIKQIALEEAEHGIRANAVGPGMIAAGMTERMRETPAAALLDLAVDLTPLKRPGRDVEIADAAVFLASARASYVTGQTIMVDGGIST